ncbi:DUF2057 domain-containing protein [Aeromonas enteropelogenes]|uniref:DUF2057 domain-containing protein n=1 Tax=Aeromonas enteropelogenes TaxID=29489 RepID=UPI0031356F94
MSGYQSWRNLALLCAAMGTGTVQAAVEVMVPEDFRILAVSEGRLHDEQHATLADGEQQLLVRFEGVIPSRNSSENDRQIRSEPQVLRYRADNQSLQLSARVPDKEQGMEAYARKPVIALQAGGQPLQIAQDALVTRGMLIGMDWNARLAEYNRSGGKAALRIAAPGGGAVVVPGGATAASALVLPQSELEGQLQQLFLQADPVLRKRFIGWAVPQL